MDVQKYRTIWESRRVRKNILIRVKINYKFLFQNFSIGVEIGTNHIKLRKLAIFMCYQPYEEIMLIYY